jgi:predicted transcriptional regulator
MIKEIPNLSGRLISISTPRTQALVLEALSDFEWHSLRDVERAADLRQPEVSMAVKALGKTIEKKVREHAGKGRPEKMVRCTKKGLVSLLENEVNKRMEEVADINEIIKEVSE